MHEALAEPRVIDPFGIASDPVFTGITAALDPIAMTQRLAEVRAFARSGTAIEVQGIEVVRHKPGRRCLIEYDVLARKPDRRRQRLTLIGKVRARHSPRGAYGLLRKFWRAGFDDSSLDGISIPQPIGWFGDLGLWLQQKVSGEPVSRVLAGPGAAMLMTRVADAAHKIHMAGIPTERAHTMADELRILREHLPKVALSNARWQVRVDRLLDACARLARSVREPAARGIHRDFHPDQLIVDGERLTVIDFDQYCQGDIGVDIGNFLGHLIEQALRDTGDPTAYEVSAAAMEERFFAVAGNHVRTSVAAYTDLTLVRHIYLSTLFEARRRLTGTLLALCEERLKGWL